MIKKKPGIYNVEKARLKARIVAKDFSWVEDIDYHEIFSPIVKHSSIRLILSTVAMFDLELEQIDVNTAFLHENLDKQFFMEQLEGFLEKRNENKACLLQKSLYGLKQSLRQWYKRFNDFVLLNGFSRNSYDHCVYFMKINEDCFVYLLIYVDDMLIVSKSMNEFNKLKNILKTKSEMKDLGLAKRILGMDMIRNTEKNMFVLSQATYIKRC